MFAIVDKRTPSEAIDKLKQFAKVFEFSSENVTYQAISCHPDIFIFQDFDSSIIVAPNSPKSLFCFLLENNIPYKIGCKSIGISLENSTYYNCVATSKHFFHKKNYTDKIVLEKVNNRKFVSLPQAYTRCSLFAYKECFLTSDNGIEKQLQKEGIDVCFVNPKGILLPPYKHGFAGGCFGGLNDTIFILGSLNNIENGKEVEQYIKSKKLDIEELYDGYLYDGGGIFFIPPPALYYFFTLIKSVSNI